MNNPLGWHTRLPDTAPLSEFSERYAFLRARPWPGATDEQDRQRYIFGYNMYVLTRTALLASAVCIALVMVTLLVTSRLDVGRIGDLLSYWPTNASLRDHILAHQLADPSYESASLNMGALLSATSVAQAVWIVWLAWRIRYEFTRTEYTVDRIGRVYAYVIISCAIWLYVFNSPITDASLYAPAFHDSTVVLAI